MQRPAHPPARAHMTSIHRQAPLSHKQAPSTHLRVHAWHQLQPAQQQLCCLRLARQQPLAQAQQAQRAGSDQRALNLRAGTNQGSSGT